MASLQCVSLGMQIQNPITACQQHGQAQEVTGKGEVGTSPHLHSATIHSYLKTAFMPLLCPLNSTAVSARRTPQNTLFLQGQDSSPIPVKQSLSSHFRAMPCSG